MTFGTFVQPDDSLMDAEDPAKASNIEIYSGYRGMDHAHHFLGHSAVFDAIVAKSASVNLNYEDQCSSQYYFDVVRTLEELRGEYRRVVEVGVFMGGSSHVLAGCMNPLAFELDMVDYNLRFLRFAYERVRRIYPEQARRIRLFHGDLPSYVRAVKGESDEGNFIVHHDGSHRFDQVVRDMAALSFVKDRLCAIIAQDTHLRGTPEHMNFVDMAIYAVFGLDLKYVPIGARYAAIDSLTFPNPYQGNYFMPDTPEGFVIPMDLNSFRYPHPSMSIDEFLPPAPASAELHAA
jgi:hypothetical protein